MRLSITDQFLWDVYKSGDIFSTIFDPYPRIGKFSGIKNPIFDKYKKEIGKERFSQLIYYLKSNNYIKVENLKTKKAIIITKKGINKTLKTSFKVVEKRKRKDRKWVMLTFDVPEKYRKSRDLLRSILQNLGYKIFQKSVWVCPYDVSEKTEKVLQYYSLDDFVKIFLIEEI